MARLYIQKISRESPYVQTPAGMWLDTPHIVVLNNELYVVGLRPEQANNDDEGINILNAEDSS